MLHLQRVTGFRPTFTPDGVAVRKARDWRTNGASAKQAAKDHAEASGAAVVLWPSGSASLYVLDAESGEVRRVRFT
jgi:hypothetical protein